MTMTLSQREVEKEKKKVVQISQAVVKFSGNEHC